MRTVGSHEAKTHLPRLLDCVDEGESVTTARRGQPVTRLVPIEGDAKTRCRQAARRIGERRKRLGGVPVAELIDSIREGRRH